MFSLSAGWAVWKNLSSNYKVMIFLCSDRSYGVFYLLQDAINQVVMMQEAYGLQQNFLKIIFANGLRIDDVVRAHVDFTISDMGSKLL